MGPSGSGKSTLLNIIGLLDSASNGSYQLLDQEMVGLKEKQKSQARKENIGFIFQNFNLIDELSD
ncbi:Bacitracin export ATP-binding protein BceA [compost metagenome]